MCTPGAPIGPIAIQIKNTGLDLPEVLRRVVRRAMELLELGEFVRGALSNVQAEVAVVVPYLQGPREVAWFGVPDHAAGILVLACPLLNNRPIGLGAVPGIQAQVGGPVDGDECVHDQEASSAAADAARARKPPLVIEAHQSGEFHELVELGAWGLLAPNAADWGDDRTSVASALLDGQAGPVDVAVLWSRLETLVAPDIDQRDEVGSRTSSPLTRSSHGAADVPRRRWECVRWRYAGVSARRHRRLDQDHGRYRQAC
jgi:hypothetical protein